MLWLRRLGWRLPFGAGRIRHCGAVIAPGGAIGLRVILGLDPERNLLGRPLFFRVVGFVVPRRFLRL
ncbi:hypothetical protein BRD19_12450 [Halobacteriales archaeon SW_7_65_23]|nr:MAG: hypothetical protein BRD19_12450 [Halobacteriales archaeon SW_7_65_23]